MTLATQMTTDLAAFFNTSDFAESVTYTAKGGAGTTIKVILAEEDGTLQGATAPGDNMVVWAKYSDISNPQRGDTFTINSATWYAVEILGGGRGESVWRIRVSRSLRPTERVF